MKEITSLKYLGDSLRQSLEESVHQTVLQRIGLAKHSIYEIGAIVEDARATKLGGINIAYSLSYPTCYTIVTRGQIFRGKQ